MQTATRRIEFDAAHRVPLHNSKCRNIHGHRYTVEMTINGDLVADGSEEGMIRDFAIMKGTLMRTIHDTCDHGLILQCNDPLLPKLITHANLAAVWEVARDISAGLITGRTVTGDGGVEKICLIDRAPTAENLAVLFHRWVCKDFDIQGAAWISEVGITVYETPNCWATYLGVVPR